jgi:hypothetical protein
MTVKGNRERKERIANDEYLIGKCKKGFHIKGYRK